MNTDLKLITFDIFGTLVDMSETPRDEIREYLEQCCDPRWRPLDLPESWANLKAFPDAAEGMRRLGGKYKISTCSNAPYRLALDILCKNSLAFDYITDLEDIRRFKPHPDCYLHACAVAGVEPHEAMMVTANPTFGPYPFGDIQIAGAIGMRTRLIRNPGGTADIIALAEGLGC